MPALGVKYASVETILALVLRIPMAALGDVRCPRQMGK